MDINHISLKFWLRYQWQKRVRRASFIPARPIFFVHIPKTAGTSFRNMLYRVIEPDATFPNYLDLAQTTGRYPDPEQLSDYLSAIDRDIRFLSGHFPFAAGTLLPHTPDYYVFLREPVARTISNLLHFQRNDPDCQGLDLYQIFDRFRGHLQNLQVRYLCDVSMESAGIFHHAEQLSKNSLRQAMRHLEQCKFIGLAEDFATSIHLAEQLLGRSLGKPLQDNPATNTPRFADPNLATYIEPAIALDRELYHYACALFEKQKLGLRQS